VGTKVIEPRVLKGFQDTLPAVGLRRMEMLRILQDVFVSFGFAPIDTPALEYAEILLGKGSDETDRQLFRFKDNGGRDVAMRFDLTVPLARFVAEHCNDLTFPFKRFHIAPVWRAEKPQRGRFREFIQCDFDTIGTDSPIADSEILSIVSTALSALGVSHQLRVNNRKILNGLLESLDAKESSVSVLRAIDKLEKLGEEVVRKELATQLSDSQIEKVFTYVSISKNSSLSREKLFSELSNLIGGSELGARGIEELSTVLNSAELFGVKSEALLIDLSIARGLDYYTGTVFETRFTEVPTIGSICSGGRYDDLASLYINRRLPGVGGSIGLDRVIAGLEELGKIKAHSSPALAYITILDKSAQTAAFELVTKIRSKGIPAEVALETAQLGGQLKYADRKGIKFAVILGEREVAQGTCSIKNLETKTQVDGVKFDDVAKEILSAKI